MAQTVQVKGEYSLMNQLLDVLDGVMVHASVEWVQSPDKSTGEFKFSVSDRTYPSVVRELEKSGFILVERMEE